MAGTTQLLADALLDLRQLPRPQAVVLRPVITLKLLLEQHRLRIASLEALRRLRTEHECADVFAVVPALVHQEVACAAFALSCYVHT
jgi:hypothetical protein